jgi:hypothetical protein
MCQNAHQVVDELHRLKILRAPHSPYLPEMSPFIFRMFGDFKEKENWKTVICKAQKNFSRHFKNCGIMSLLKSFKWYLNHGAIGCAIIEHDGTYFRKWHIYKSPISWTSKNQRMFSLLFGHPVYICIYICCKTRPSFWILGILMFVTVPIPFSESPSQTHPVSLCSAAR